MMRRFRGSVFHGREENFCMHENRHNAPREKNKTEKRNRPLLNCHVLKKRKKKRSFQQHSSLHVLYPKSCRFSLVCFQKIKACIPGSDIKCSCWLLLLCTQGECVFVSEREKEGGRETSVRKIKEKPKAQRQKIHPKYIKVYGYICRSNVTFIIRSRQDALSDRSGRTGIGFCLH